jgi:hypothetical protein
MPLSSALPQLKLDIWSALETARTSIPAGAESGKAPALINKQLGADIGDAIHFYTTQAVVDTTVVTVLAGVAAPLAPTGAAPVAGAGTGKGVGVLL